MLVATNEQDYKHGTWFTTVDLGDTQAINNIYLYIHANEFPNIPIFLVHQADFDVCIYIFKQDDVTEAILDINHANDVDKDI